MSKKTNSFAKKVMAFLKQGEEHKLIRFGEKLSNHESISIFYEQIKGNC